jgi:hypothetical protein
MNGKGVIRNFMDNEEHEFRQNENDRHDLMR